MSLADAKALTDRVLDGQNVTFAVADHIAAAAVVARLVELGAHASIVAE